MALRTIGRWLGRRRRRGQLGVVHHPQYRPPETDLFDTRRAERVLAWLVEKGATRREDVLAPEPASMADLARVHDPGYLARLQDPETLRRALPGVSEADLPLALATQRRMAGGTLLAARTALAEGDRVSWVASLGGGLHHARRDQASGFCLLNDVAVAVAALRAGGFDGRVLVCDLDLHPGDGTRDLFRDDPTVFTFSVHAEDPGGAEGAVADRSVALGSGVSDAAYLAALDAELPAALEASRPDLVFYVAGVDVAHDDALGSWRVTDDGVRARDERVDAATRGVPRVWLLSGGYGPDAWRHSARSLAAVGTGRDRPIPSGHQARLADLARLAGAGDAVEAAAGDDFGITARDLFGDLARAPGERRFLGLWNAWGLEVALERVGVIARVRERGYAGVDVELDLDGPTGDRMRLRSEDHGRDLLIDLVARETAELPPWRLLAVEWLLIQDPRRPPAPGRPLLPGQEHPGLGCLAEVVGLLASAAEALGVDGLLYRPAWYHMAVFARGFMRFLDPRDEARLAAMKHALEGLPLADASWAAARGEVVDAATSAPAPWVPAPMVLPLSPRLRAAVDGPGPDGEVAAHAVRLKLGAPAGR